MKLSNFPPLRKHSDGHPNIKPLLHAGNLGTLFLEGIGSELECDLDSLEAAPRRCG